jgi:hypothetical protein
VAPHQGRGHAAEEVVGMTFLPGKGNLRND